MKWHKFLIYFWSLLGALIFLIRGFGNLLDCFDGADALIHAAGTSAFAVTLFTGVCLLGIAALQLAARAALARFSRRGPKMAVAVYVSMAVLDGFILAAQKFDGDVVQPRQLPTKRLKSGEQPCDFRLRCGGRKPDEDRAVKHRRLLCRVS